MSDYTNTGDVTWDQTAYDRLTYFGFLPMLHFDRFAEVRATRQAMPGASVVFNKTAYFASATSALDESTDVIPVSMSDSQVTVTLAEYGNAVKTTAKLRGVSYIEVDPVAARLIGENAGRSVDEVARVPFYAGTNVIRPSDKARNQLTPADEITSSLIRRGVAQLRASDVPTFEGKYAGIIHPHVSLDLREETGTAAWRDPHIYSEPGAIWNGEIGEYEGVRWIETSTALYWADAGSSTTLTDVYGTVLVGREAVAKAHANAGGYGAQPMFGRTPVTDNLERFTGYYWKHLVGYEVFRQESLWRIETASSIGDNA